MTSTNEPRRLSLGSPIQHPMFESRGSELSDLGVLVTCHRFRIFWKNFRAEKKWDLAIVHNKELLAAIEFKSQVGPSFGNNFNNRTEEALGSATDIWAAYREGAFRPSSRPFLGYLMLLDDCDRSRSPVKVFEPHFPVFPEFKSASYRDRYAILVEKLLRDRIYDGACFLLSNAASAKNGDYIEPHPELTFAKFVTPLVAQVSAICQAKM